MTEIDTRMPPEQERDARLRRFYRFQSKIYVWTRWAFLFGRKEVIRRLKLPTLDHYVLLEVGCGPGTNLEYLATEFPNMRLMGVDISPDMLAQAQQRAAQFNGRVLVTQASITDPALKLAEKPDITLFSYVLTMMNPGYEEALLRAKKEMDSGGLVAIVDFHRTRWRPFRWWMTQNHVRMEGQVLEVAQREFIQTYLSVKPAFFGLWEYFIFVGIRR
jgi:S-adenosylmethionine-diacylgycerolhomoserine-N-methlytransferase